MKIPQRTIEEAFIEGRGTLTSTQLLEMRDDDWGFLRDEVTRFAVKGEGLSLICHECGGPVYIRAVRARDEKSRPLFAHRNGADHKCPWFTGETITPDAAREAQYQGRQVSPAHEQICALIEELVNFDARYIRSTRGTYLPPEANEWGRYPDVYVEWQGLRPFVVEYQRSRTSQNEVTARTLHYAKEGISLLWVFSHIDQINLPQSFRDVIRHHRGNAFVLDQAAVAASREQKTLVLSCYLQNGELFEPPVLVRYDRLTVPKQNLPFYEDRIVAPLLDSIALRRRSYLPALQAFVENGRSGVIDVEELESFGEQRRSVDRLIALAFSIVETAAGRKTNFATGHPDFKEGINNSLDVGPVRQYADLLETLIQNTAARGLLKTKVRNLLDGARSGYAMHMYPTPQVDEKSREWALLRQLLPEALDPVVRAELDFYESLPEWAV
jgi:hypothetical protein